MSTLRQFALIALAAVVLAAPVHAQSATQGSSASTIQDDVSIATPTPEVADDDIGEAPAEPPVKR